MVLITFLAAGFAAWKYFYQNSAASSAETWVAGRGITRTLKLLDSGEYIADEACDVCTSKPVKGRWSKSNNQTTLVPSNSDKTFVLIELKYRGCVGLVPADKVINMTEVRLNEVYFREKDTCPDSL
jgi:hypothetical protein